MRRELVAMVAVSALWACGGQTLGVPSGGDGGSSSSSGSSSGGSSGGSSSGSSGGSSSSSGGSSSSSGGSGSSSGGVDAGRVPTNHRPNDSECTAPAAPGNCPGGGGLPGACDADPQCTSGSDGRCIQPSSGVAQGCQCTYDACADDAACPMDQTCACHGSPYTDSQGNTCVAGNCRVDADCGAGGYCSPSSLMAICGYSLAGYYCHTPMDQCTDDSDCSTAQGPAICAYSTATSRWQCETEAFCG